MTNPDDQNLSALLDALRRAQSDDSAPSHVESAVMLAWDASHAPAVSTVRVAAASWVASLAAAAVLAISLTVVGGRLRSAAVVAPLLAAEAPTVILVGEPVLAGEQVRRIRMSIPASALHAIGVTSTAALEDDVDVDVIVGEDGVARALSLNP